MVELYLETIKNSKYFHDELKPMIDDFDKTSLATKAEMAKLLFVQKQQCIKALDLMGKTIYKIGCERDHYIEKIGEINQEDQQKYINLKIKVSESKMNEYILKELKKASSELRVLK